MGKDSIRLVINGGKKVLKDVYYISALRRNIIGLGQATEAGCDVNMKDNTLKLVDKNGLLMVKTTRAKNRLYKVTLHADHVECLQVTTCAESTLWHPQLGHINKETMRSMAKKELVTGVPEVENFSEACVSCLKGKQTRKPFPQATSFRESNLLELVHADLCGPITSPTPAHKRYIFFLINDYSRYMWTVLIKEKSEAFEKFKIFKLRAEQETKTELKTLRTDRGSEFVSHEFQSYCDKLGINGHLTAPYSPQQNRVVERRNRTLLEMTRGILKHMSVPNHLWGEAVRHATYLINRVATRSLEGMTPYEALRSRKSNLTHLKVFGCVCYARTEMAGRKKLDKKSKVLVHLGTEPGSKSYRLLDPLTKQIAVSRNVVFDENKLWCWTEQAVDKEVGKFTFVQRRCDDVTTDVEASETTNVNEDDDERGEEEVSDDGDSDDNIQPRRSTRLSTKPAYLDDYILMEEVESERLLMVINDEPCDFNEGKKLEVWIVACKDEIFSIEKNNTWDLVELPSGVKPIGLKWVFKIKRNADGLISKYKARLVAKGYVQRHRVDYDEVFAPVARIETIRLIIALEGSHGWEIHHIDVKTAFLHGELKEDVFVTRPKGFVVAGEENKVYKLKNALYGL